MIAYFVALALWFDLTAFWMASGKRKLCIDQQFMTPKPLNSLWPLVKISKIERSIYWKPIVSRKPNHLNSIWFQIYKNLSKFHLEKHRCRSDLINPDRVFLKYSWLQLTQNFLIITEILCVLYPGRASVPVPDHDLLTCAVQIKISGM